MSKRKQTTKTTPVAPVAENNNTATATTQTLEPTPVQPEPTPAPQGWDHVDTSTPQKVDPTQAALAKVLARATEMAARQTKSTPRLCVCGCGLMTKGGTWFTGHNGIALKRALQEVRAGKALTTAAGETTNVQ